MTMFKYCFPSFRCCDFCRQLVHDLKLFICSNLYEWKTISITNYICKFTSKSAFFPCCTFTYILCIVGQRMEERKCYPVTEKIYENSREIRTTEQSKERNDEESSFFKEKEENRK